MSGLIMLILSLVILPHVAAILVAGFFLLYGVKIIVEKLGDANVPDKDKAIIVLVLGVVLHILVFHPDILAWLPRIP